MTCVGSLGVQGLGVLGLRGLGFYVGSLTDEACWDLASRVSGPIFSTVTIALICLMVPLSF